MEAKIADLEIIRGSLREAMAAGCDDVPSCADHPDCPLPFAEVIRRLT
ncbi:hypothetical protein EV193_117106 [Herbihabitans rhizosphaerae]|uniref:Uncharacterized protein n=1 Tax=Herbihabitans rhizosphaerae TaxID=1872711 RepID=A0A4Q7KBR1_9PSEU|nr:hypothetical protein [Herbihabitans rhizosphaerae]RZS30408.1 hypothetical protein EV193_117106 [Herbihabitans rhizosphaerae]